MNLTQDLEKFTNELTHILQQLEQLKNNHPNMFREVLPQVKELRLEDALIAIQNAHYEAEKALLNAGTDLLIDT